MLRQCHCNNDRSAIIPLLRQVRSTKEAQAYVTEQTCCVLSQTLPRPYPGCWGPWQGTGNVEAGMSCMEDPSLPSTVQYSALRL